MKKEALELILSDIDPKLVEEAGSYKRKPLKWKIALEVAAALTIIALVAFLAPRILQNGRDAVRPPITIDPPVVDPPIVVDPPVVDPPVVDPPSIGGGGDEFMRAYIDEVYDIYPLSQIEGRSEELDEWVQEVFLKQSRREMNSLPDMYQAIKGLGITKEELLTVAHHFEDVSIIDKLYLPEDEMQAALAAPTSLVYGGEVYCLWDILGRWKDEEAKADAERIKQLVPKDVMEKYIDLIRRALIKHDEKGYVTEWKDILSDGIVSE